MSERGIFDALQKRYPAPSVDFQWISECCQALLDDGQQPTLESVEEQFLFSDLAQSTTSDFRSVPIPPNPHKVILFPKPTLFQITSITEIGSSAFQLQTVAEQRKDILSGQTLIRRMDDEVVDGEDEEVDNKKLPVYPRGMLKLELSAGDGRVLKAIEYRRISELRLGETSLGTKLLVQNVKVLRGILMLEPSNTQCLGGMVDHLEMDQPASFLAGLARRMGKPVPGDALVVNQRAPRLPPPVRHDQPIQPRARAQPPHPSRAQASSSRARSREVQTQLPFSQSQSPEKPNSGSVRPATTRQTQNQNARGQSPPMSVRRTPRAASTAASAKVAGLYHQTQLTRDGYGDETPSKRARTSQQTTSRLSRHAPAPRNIEEIDDDDDDEFDMEFDDSFLLEVDKVAASANRLVPPVEVDVDDTSIEYGFEDDDSSFIRQVDEAEARATQRTQPITTSRFFSTSTTAASGRASGSGSGRHKSTSNPRSKMNDQRPVYVIDSDGSSGKENHDPNDSDVVYISD